jgi:hypothetical protein
MAKLGQTVIYRQPQDDRAMNGHKDHPAIVTCVHPGDMVNVKVFFDGGNCEDRTSVLYRPTALKKELEHLATWDYE